VIDKPGREAEPNPDRARTTLAIGAICAVAGLVLLGLGFVFTRRLIDFPVYYAAGRSLIAGRMDLYAPDFALGPLMDYRYPPFFLVALMPLWRLPYGVAGYVWYLISIICIAGSVFSAGQGAGLFHLKQKASTRENSPVLAGRNSAMAWTVVAVAVVPYFVMNLHYGNAELLTIALLFTGLFLLIRGSQISGAMAVALSISIKVTPAFALVYFALKRRWKSVVLVLLMVALINLAPAAYFGFNRNTGLIGAWYRHVVQNQSFHEENGPVNLSLKGQLRRYLSEVDYGQRVDKDKDYPSINIARFPAGKLRVLWLVLEGVLSLIIAGFLIFRQDRRPADSSHQVRGPLLQSADQPTTPTEPDGSTNAVVSTRSKDSRNHDSLELAAIICWMLIAEPLTSKIYFIALLWPIASLARYAWSESSRQARRLRGLLISLAAVNFALPLVPGRLVQRALLVVGTDFWLTCLLLGLLLWVLNSVRSAIPVADAA